MSSNCDTRRDPGTHHPALADLVQLRKAAAAAVSQQAAQAAWRSRPPAAELSDRASAAWPGEAVRLDIVDGLVVGELVPIAVNGWRARLWIPTRADPPAGAPDGPSS